MRVPLEGDREEGVMSVAEIESTQSCWPHGLSAGSGAEPQELPLVPDSLTPQGSGELRRGSQSGGTCPKGGFIRLTSVTGRVGVFPTVCKSWRCNVCRRKKKALVIERIQYGCSKLGSSYSITLTFRVEGEGRRDAVSAERALRGFWRSMRIRYPHLAYFKVLELTKKRQPHYHVIVGGLGMDRRDHCRRKKEMDERNLRGLCKVGDDLCVEHEVSAAWRVATGDSYVVQVDSVYAVRGLGFYLGKYLTKTFFEEDEDSVALGFGRRWASSNNWPRFPKLQLRATSLSKPGRSGWRRVQVLGRRGIDRYVAEMGMRRTPIVEGMRFLRKGP